MFWEVRLDPTTGRLYSYNTKDGTVQPGPQAAYKSAAGKSILKVMISMFTMLRQVFDQILVLSLKISPTAFKPNPTETDQRESIANID